MRSKTRPVVLLVGGVLSLALLAGCGGGGGGGGGNRSSTPTPAPTANAATGTVRLRLNWPSRASRALPGAAESVRAVLMLNGNIVDSRTVARDPNQSLNAYDDQVVFGNLAIGNYQIVVTAYPNADATGVVLTQGTIDFPLTPTQPERVAEVTPGQTVTSAVQRLVINTNRVPVGQNTTLTATAYNASNEAVPVNAGSLRWSVEGGKGVTVTQDGTLFATQSGSVAVTVTDPDSGKSQTQAIQCGYGTQVTISTSGAMGAVPFISTPYDDNEAAHSQIDGQMVSVQSTAGDGSTASFLWQGNSSVATSGAPVTIKAPATYGDRQFVKWQLGGVDLGADSLLSIDPKTAGNPDLTAVYTPRAAGADGYTPNHLRDRDLAMNNRENRTVLWNTAKNKITFIRTSLFNDGAKARAVEGFQLWQKSVGNRFGFEVIGDDQPDSADIVVIFADRNNISPLPSTYVPGYTLGTVNSSYVGLTLYNFVTDSNGQRYGTSKRVIYLFSQSEALAAIAAHELGHATGFVGHSESVNDIMYPTVTVRHLSERDVNSFLTVQVAAQADANTRAAHTRAVGKPVQSEMIP